MSRPDRRARRLAVGPRHGGDPRRGPRRGARRPYVAPPPARPYIEELERRPGSAADRRSGPSPLTEHDADPDVRRGGARRRRSCWSRSGTTVEEPDLSALRRACDLVEHLPRPAGRPGRRRSLDQLGDDRRPADHRRRRRAADLGAGREGPRATAPAEYLRRVGHAPGDWRAMVAGLYESGYDLLLTPTMAEPPPPLGTFDDSGPDPIDAFKRRVPLRRVHRRSSTRPASRRSRCPCTGPTTACRSASSSSPRSAARTC